jgi:hypothetical protein
MQLNMHVNCCTDKTTDCYSSAPIRHTMEVSQSIKQSPSALSMLPAFTLLHGLGACL